MKIVSFLVQIDVNHESLTIFIELTADLLLAFSSTA